MMGYVLCQLCSIQLSPHMFELFLQVTCVFAPSVVNYQAQSVQLVD